MRFIPGGPLAADAVEPMLERHVTENARGLGFYAVEERASGSVVGEVGFAIFETGEREVGWTLAQAYWGRGYATEAARALLAPTDIAVIDAENAASIRVAERLALSQREERTLHGRRHLIFWKAV
jgi:RimJ/RimL family protein N-acetyltransferase